MRKASKVLCLLAAIFGIFLFLDSLLSVVYMFIGGFVPGLVLGIISLVEGSGYPFIPIGVSVMGGLWIGGLLMLPLVLIPIPLIVISFIAFANKPNKGKGVIFIIGLVISILTLYFNGLSVAPLLLLLGSIFGRVAVSEERKALEQEEPQVQE